MASHLIPSSINSAEELAAAETLSGTLAAARAHAQETYEHAGYNVRAIAEMLRLPDDDLGTLHRLIENYKRSQELLVKGAVSFGELATLLTSRAVSRGDSLLGFVGSHTYCCNQRSQPDTWRVSLLEHLAEQLGLEFELHVKVKPVAVDSEETLDDQVSPEDSVEADTLLGSGEQVMSR